MSEESQFALLKQRRFAPFFLTQALGAFNDNVYKNALAIAVAFQMAHLSESEVNVFVNIAAGLFILPFFLFSPVAGQLADRYEKSRLIRRIKLAEILIMLLGGLAFWIGNVWGLIAVLFLMGSQSAFFGPVKFGILPQHLREEELIGGNGLVGMGTFVAILLGTLLGGLLVALGSQGHWLVSITLLLLACAGYLASRSIPEAPPVAAPEPLQWNPVRSLGETWGYLRGNRTVLLSVLGVAWFWFYGSIILPQIPNYARLVLGGSEAVATALLAAFSLGIGLGSLLCERLSGHRVELGLVPLGSIGLTVFGIDLYFARPDLAQVVGLDFAGFLAAPGSWRVLIDLSLLGLFGGLYIVPLMALIQSRTEPERRSRVIAGLNLLSAVFMVLAALLAIILFSAGLTLPQLLLVAALMNAAVALYIYQQVPEFLMRFLVWVLISTLYRVRARGLEHLPERGPALIVCNHVSYVDALVIGGTIRRPTRFVMYHLIYRIPLLNFIFRTAKAIPIAGGKEDPALKEQAFEKIAEALRAGELVVIFPEGGLTTDGAIAPFRQGVDRILAETPVPVIPMALRGLWGSLFSRHHRHLGRPPLPRRFWSKLDLIVGPPLAPEAATASELEQQVKALYEAA